MVVVSGTVIGVTYGYNYVLLQDRRNTGVLYHQLLQYRNHLGVQPFHQEFQSLILHRFPVQPELHFFCVASRLGVGHSFTRFLCW